MAKFWLNNKDYKAWTEKYDVFEQASIVSNWMGWEDCGYIMELSLGEIFDLYVFVVFEIGVEFCSGVYDLIEEEEMEHEYETSNKVEKFNKVMGKEIL